MAASPTWLRLNAALDKWGGILVDRIKKELRIDKTVASRKTINTLSHDVKDDGKFHTIVFSAEEAYGSAYTVLEFIDKGRQGGVRPPPWGSIALWMLDKNIRPKKNGKFIKASDQNMKRSAIAIATQIGRTGTIKRFGHKGSRVMINAIEPIQEPMGADLLQAWGEDAQEYIERGLTIKPR